MRRVASSTSAALLLAAASTLVACPSPSEDGSADASAVAQDGAPSTDAASANGDASTHHDASGGDAASTNEPPVVSLTFHEGTAAILNPERGFWEEVPLIGGNFSNERQNGFTVAHSYVRLDAFRSSPLDAAFSSALQSGFDAVRAAGVKVVPRFTYNFAQGDPDAPLSVIQGHIAQLQPVLAANADVIATLQAGFIGAWGEWHHSTNGLDDTSDRAAVANALLGALPSSRFIQVRYPYEKDAIWGPITSAAAFGGTNAARVGEHNDCFLASDDDEGTYFNPPTTIDTLKAYVANEGRFSPVGGETCNLDAPRSDCATASKELSDLHWSFINSQFDLDVLNRWKTDGCYEAIQSHLGYRLFLTGASYSERVHPGGLVSLDVALRNSGFANPFNARPVYVVLKGKGLKGNALHLTALLPTVDPRTWAAGAAASFHAQLRVPADVPAGTYTLALWLPDAADRLKGLPAYAIELANDGVWDAATGESAITTTFQVDDAAPGAVDPGAKSFTAL